MHELGDKRCPQCKNPSSVKWKSNGVIRRAETTVEWGYYHCELCGWHSEFHEVTLVEN